MDALKMYIKDKASLALFYNLTFIVAIFIIWTNIIDFSSGNITENTVKSLILIPITPFAGLYFWILAKDLILVLLDYKKQELITATFRLRGGGYRNCNNQKNGAYFMLSFCDQKKDFWMYNQNQVYFDVVPQEIYKVVYYKYSKCIKSIERTSFNRKNVKQKKKETAPKKPLKINHFKVFFDNYIDGFIFDLFVLITMPFCMMLLKYIYNDCVQKGMFDLFYISIAFFIVFYLFFIRLVVKRIISFLFYKIDKTNKETLTIIGVPRTKKFLSEGKPHELFLYTVNLNNKKKNLKFYSTDILGLGNLEERPGYKGYGNFIGTKYEVEYYKVSHIIKSMKLLSQPEDQPETNQTNY